MARAVVAGAATLYAPTVLLRESIDREAILRSFCVREYCCRYDIADPFSQGAWTYATDARWIVRAELVSMVDDGEPKRRPNAELICSGLWDDSAVMREFCMPALDHLVEGYEDCPVCKGRRIDVRDNWTAYTGDLDFDPDDGTIADRSCAWCWDPVKKKTKSKIKSCVMFGDKVFGANRLANILSIPDVRIAEVSRKGAFEDSGLIQFEGSGFSGFMTGMKYE
jgi:hypothetical protein